MPHFGDDRWRRSSESSRQPAPDSKAKQSSRQRGLQRRDGERWRNGRKGREEEDILERECEGKERKKKKKSELIEERRWESTENQDSLAATFQRCAACTRLWRAET